MDTTFWARTDSNSANNPALNLTKDPAIEITFTWASPTGPTGDVILEHNSGNPDATSMVSIGGTEYSFTFEYTGTLPTAKKDGAQQVPDQFEGHNVYLISVHDYPTSGETMRLAFLPDDNASQAEMDDFGKGAIDIQAVDDTPDPVPVCFVRGTMIATPNGEEPVESLTSGDKVLTASGRKATIRWIAFSHFSQAQMQFSDNLRPVCIPRHSFGVGKPHRDLWVSPQHRVALSGWLVELNLGIRDVFVRAKHLLPDQSWNRAAWSDGVDYFHLLFDKHEVIVSNGLPSESFHPGDEALKNVGPEVRKSLETVLDKRQSKNGQEREAALYTATAHEALLVRPAQPLLRIVA